uniref:VIN3-1 n=1 Tax=Raphanus sativus TaxID=3726 RepID=I7FFQ7_RAPSA|nr:VIN3-1 [Raphanus sativus]
MQAASLSKNWRFDSTVGPEDIDPSSFQGIVCTDFPKKKGLSVSERRELIHALSNQPEEASELSNSWSRDEIMKIICAEMGKERKYTGLAKPKLIETLLKLVSRPLGETSPCPHRKRKSKKKRKTTASYIICCENIACRAALGTEDAFCRRCSCCVCQNFDEDKDPSLWLTCEACGLSCHLECALEQARYGIGCGDDEVERAVDGRFYCVFCGKDNDLLGCWRQRVKVAKETQRVDVFCYRVSLGQKLLRGTRKYQYLLELMNEAVKKLESDVGPLSMKMASGMVQRLSSGSQVQKLCSLAMEALDKMVSPPLASVSGQGDKLSVRVEEIQASSVTVVRLDSEEPSSSSQNLTGFRLFCGKTKEDGECSSQVNCVVHQPETRSTIQALEPVTEFCPRVVAFNEEGDLDESELEFSTLKDEAGNMQGLLTNSSTGLCSNPSLPEDASNNVLTSCCKENGDNDNAEVESERLVKRKVNEIEGREVLIITPCRRDTYKGKQEGNKRSKPRTATVNEKPETNVAKGDNDLGHIAKTIRCLEQEGHIDKSFRERFLTWYSLRATHREVRVVKLFVETFMDDLSSLGQQLVHTFSECMLSKRSSTTTGVVPGGICLKLWH